MTDYILETIEDYIRAEEPLHYGLMLKGKWGCGKTYYIKNTVRPRLNKSVPDTGSKQKTGVYVSLNGLQAIEEIDSQINTILFTKSEGKENEVVGFLSGAFSSLVSINKATKALQDIGGRTLKAVARLMAENKGIYLIFDDVERCEIPIKRLFGYINRFVEQCDKRVILIADETKLVEIENYRSIKEKLIGQTLDYRPSEEDIVRASIQKTEGRQTRDILSKHFEIIKECFRNSKSDNIRLLCMGLRHLDRAIKALGDKINKLDDYRLDSLIRFTLGVTFELGGGKESSFIEMALKTNPLVLAWVEEKRSKGQGEQEDEVETYFKEFRGRYCEIGPIRFQRFSPMFDLVAHGKLDIEAFKRELNLAEEQLRPEYIPNFLSRELESISPEEFDKHTNILIQTAAEGGLPDPANYLEGVKFLAGYHSKSLVEGDFFQTIQQFRSGFIRASEKNEWFAQQYSPTFNDSDGLEKVYKKSITEFIEYTKDFLCKHQENKLNEYLGTSLKNDFESFLDTLRGEHTDLGELVGSLTPLLHKIDPSILAHQLREGSNWQVRSFCGVLRGRYRMSNAREFFFEELGFFEQFQRTLQSLLDDKDEQRIDKIKRYYLTLVLKEVSEIIEKLTPKADADAKKTARGQHTACPPDHPPE